MTELDVGKTTTTNLSGVVQDVQVPSMKPDAVGAGGKFIKWDFPYSGEYLGYFQTIPELHSALRVLSQRVCGQSWIADKRTTYLLKNIRVWGEDSFDTIIRMMLIEKKVFGDSFAEIIRDYEDRGSLLNLKKLYTGDMIIVLDEKGLISEYIQKSNVPGGKEQHFKPWQILHLCNERLGNEMHGTSIIPVLKQIIDSKNEAMSDERKIRHRELALGVLYVDEDDTTKLNEIKAKYADATNKGEVLVLPKDVATLGDNPNSPRDRIQWLQYLDNLFYQVVGIPKVLVTSEGFTEAGGKAGLLAFEPNEIAEKIEMEADLYNQLGLEIKFTRSPSLLGEAVETEQKNAGQTGIQQNETQVSPTRTE